MGPYNDKDPTNFIGEKLIETTESNNFYILNTMFATRSDEHRWSFHSNLGYKRRLDYIMADWYVKRATTNCRVYPMQSQIFESDHSIVVMQAVFPTRKQVKKIFGKKKMPSFYPDIRKLRDDPEIQATYSAKLELLLADDPSTMQLNEMGARTGDRRHPGGIKRNNTI